MPSFFVLKWLARGPLSDTSLGRKNKTRQRGGTEDIDKNCHLSHLYLPNHSAIAFKTLSQIYANLAGNLKVVIDLAQKAPLAWLSSLTGGWE